MEPRPTRYPPTSLARECAKKPSDLVGEDLRLRDGWKVTPNLMF